MSRRLALEADVRDRWAEFVEAAAVAASVAQPCPVLGVYAIPWDLGLAAVAAHARWQAAIKAFLDSIPSVDAPDPHAPF